MATDPAIDRAACQGQEAVTLGHPRQAYAYLTLAAVSGSCGLAWEVLYARLFANVFGNGFVVTGLVLASVFLGMALGAWLSERILRHLVWIELSIGLCSGAVALVLGMGGIDAIAWMPSGVFRNLALVALLAPPMTMIGTCVPLFAHGLDALGNRGPAGFMKVYGLYNLGAFSSVLLIEFLLLRQLGLMGSASLIACLNLLIAASLLWLSPRMRTAQPRTPFRASNLRWNIGVAVFCGSFASGVFQLLTLKLSFAVFGPLQENFAILLAAAILGIAVGADIARRRSTSVVLVLAMALYGTLLFLLGMSLFVHGWGWINALSLSDGALTLAKILLLGIPPFGLFTVFGMLVPVALQAHESLASETNGSRGHSLAGRLLAISSLGNGLGALVMFLWLYRLLPAQMILLVISSALLLGLAVLHYRKPPRTSQLFGASILALLVLLAGYTLWPQTSLLLGYRTLESADLTRTQRQQFESAQIYKAYDQDASLVSFSDGNQALILNGYRSLTFGPETRATLHEVIVGATPALFSSNTNNALVLGLGTGITAGATARLFEQTKVVEINPAIFNIPPHFAKENAGLMQRESVDIRLEDGLSGLISDGRRYDAIVNTVTSPKYYSASKLYTKDFYDLVKTRLSPGGIYSSWFDLSISLDGMAVMLNTLEASFEHCRYFVLSSGYFNVVCAQSPLIYRSTQDTALRLKATGIESIFASHGLPLGFEAALRDLEVSFEERFFTRTTPDLNTLNRPVIEFQYTSGTGLEEAADHLAQTILANIEFRRQTAFGRPGWRQACRTIGWMSRLQFSGC